MFDGDSERVPTHAITLGLQEILNAEEIHLVVTGAAKAGILRLMLQTPEPDERLPASWLRLHPQVLLLSLPLLFLPLLFLLFWFPR